MSAPSGRIGREDLEAKLAEVADALNAASEPARRTAFRLSVTASLLAVLAGYFLGRRRGRLARTLVEVRRY